MRTRPGGRREAKMQLHMLLWSDAKAHAGADATATDATATTAKHG